MPQHDDTLLIFRIDRIPCAVPADSVQAIVLPPEQLTQPPGSNKGRPGIFRHQGHVYAVVDLHQRFGLDCPRRGSGRLLLYENGPRRHALWVDKVEELLRSEAGRYTTLPRYLPHELFHSGFLYRDEIVLCTTLEALLAMRDAAPIQCHLEQLREQEQERKREQQAAAKTIEPPPKPVIAEIKTEPRAEKKEPAPAPVAPRPAAKRAAAPVPPPKPRQERAVPVPLKAEKITPPARKAAPATAVPPPDVPPQPELHTHSVNISDNGNDSRLPLLLLLLLALAGLAAGLYLLWPQSAQERPRPLYIPPPPRPLQEPAAPPIEPVIEQPVEVVTPEAEPPPPAEVAVDEMVEEKVEEPVIEAEVSPALQVGKDDAGMITLIIEHQRLLELEREIAPAAEEAVDEEPLEPDADWPKPTRQIEPCDCIHIVVKGDTLWDIAKRYTHNALNYPELARRSGIRDPHWIYPGDRVHLIIR